MTFLVQTDVLKATLATDAVIGTTVRVFMNGKEINYFQIYFFFPINNTRPQPLVSNCIRSGFIIIRLYELC